MLAYETNCAGHSCPDAEGCRRYQMRLPVKTSDPDARPSFAWASLDIERLVMGDCLGFIAYRERAH